MTPGRMRVIRALGWRNLAYLLFTLALLPLAATLNAMGSPGSRGEPGTLGAVLLWAGVSLPFVLVNISLLVRDLVSGWQGGHPGQALLACALPFMVATLAG